MKNAATIKILLLAGIAIIAMLLLAASLPHLQFRSGETTLLSYLWQQFLEGLFQVKNQTAPMPLDEHGMIALMLQVLMSVMLVGLPFGVVYFFTSRDFRKQVIKQLKPWVMLLACLYLMKKLAADGALKKFLHQDSASKPLDAVPVTRPAWTSFSQFAEHPSQWLMLASSLTLALVIAALLWYVIVVFYRRSQHPSPRLNTVSEAAQQAISSFRIGGDFQNMVIRCYAEMSRALKAEKGLARQDAMTVREFERCLTDAGLPSPPVQQLTRIFEDVRYGSKIPDTTEEQRTVASLQAIIEACKPATPKDAEKSY